MDRVVPLTFDNTTLDLIVSLTQHLLQNESALGFRALNANVQEAGVNAMSSISQLFYTSDNSSSLTVVSANAQGWVSDLLMGLANQSVSIKEFKTQASDEAIAARVVSSDSSAESSQQSGWRVGSPLFYGIVGLFSALVVAAAVTLGLLVRSRVKGRSIKATRAPIQSQLNIMDRMWSALPTPPRGLTPPRLMASLESPTRIAGVEKGRSHLTLDFDLPQLQRSKAARRLTEIDR